MEDDATDSPRGTGQDTESSLTKSTAPIETIPPTPLSGVVGRVIPLGTQDHNFLSSEEVQRLARIRKDRANRFMVSVTDVDFLLEVIGRLGA